MTLKNKESEKGYLDICKQIKMLKGSIQITRDKKHPHYQKLSQLKRVRVNQKRRKIAEFQRRKA